MKRGAGFTRAKACAVPVRFSLASCSLSVRNRTRSGKRKTYSPRTTRLVRLHGYDDVPKVTDEQNAYVATARARKLCESGRHDDDDSEYNDT